MDLVHYQDPVWFVYTCARECASYIIDRHCAQQRTRERSSFTAFRKDLAAPIYSLYYRVDEAEFRDLCEKRLHEDDASRVVATRWI